MNIIFTLDYELFLGEKTGSVQKCLLDPLNSMMKGVEEYAVKFTLFVDAAYLYRLSEYVNRYPELEHNLDQITNHLRYLEYSGHDIQFHVHPHWFYSTFNGKEWVLDHDHYKLSDLSIVDAENIFLSSKKLLDSLISKPSIAFRAGGFSAQPTAMLTRLFDRSGIKVDSSVCPGISYDSPQQKYDYLNTPAKTCYYFNSDICVEDENGKFLEIPVSTDFISPFFYWKLVLNRLLKSPMHKLFGDGCAVKATSESITRRLTQKTMGIATIDGYKINSLKKTYLAYKDRGDECFCVLGHPKLATPYSINKWVEFCKYTSSCKDEFLTISQIYDKKIENNT